MDSQVFFFLQTANKIQGSTMQQMKTLKPVWTYLTSLETAHKFVNVVVALNCKAVKMLSFLSLITVFYLKLSWGHCKSNIRIIDVTKTGSLRRIKQPPTVTLNYFLQVPFPYLYLKFARVYQSTTLRFIKKIPAKTCHLCKLRSQRLQYRKYQIYTVFMPMTTHLTCIWRNPRLYMLNEGH